MTLVSVEINRSEYKQLLQNFAKVCYQLTAMIDSMDVNSDSFLSGAYSRTGPITSEECSRILIFMSSPTTVNWMNISDIKISKGTALSDLFQSNDAPTPDVLERTVSDHLAAIATQLHDQARVLSTELDKAAALMTMNGDNHA